MRQRQLDYQYVQHHEFCHAPTTSAMILLMKDSSGQQRVGHHDDGVPKATNRIIRGIAWDMTRKNATTGVSTFHHKPALASMMASMISARLTESLTIYCSIIPMGMIIRRLKE